MKMQEEKSRVFSLIQKHLLQKGGGEVKAKNLPMIITVTSQKES